MKPNYDEPHSDFAFNFYLRRYTEEHFAGIIDLVENRAAVWNGEELGASFDYLPIPEVGPDT